MKIDIRSSAINDLKKLDKSKAEKILKAIFNLANYPNVSNIKKLVNHKPTHRLRVGDYRFYLISKIIILLLVE